MKKGIPPIIILIGVIGAIVQTKEFWIIVGVFVIVMVVMIILMNNSKRKKEEERLAENRRRQEEVYKNFHPVITVPKDAVKSVEPEVEVVMLGEKKNIKCTYTTYPLGDIAGGNFKAELQGDKPERHKVLKNYNKTLLECDVRDIVERWDKEDEEEKKAQEKRRRAEEERKKSIERVRLSYKIENILPDGVLDVDKISGCAKGDTIEEKCLGLLRTSKYPIKWECRPDVSFSGGVLIVDYSLPIMDDLPVLIGIKSVRGKPKYVDYGEKEMLAVYNDVLYMIVLRNLFEIFSCKALSEVESCAFNGWVTIMDSAVGKMKTKCIMSIMAGREAVMNVDFLNVSPKVCFKGLKGIGCAELSTMTAIKPIMEMKKTDKRFIQQEYEVSGNIDSSTNLAAMPWQDFEYLIRELFERMFSKDGGEVKVTRASRDGGVDAVAFDPDPIRGGKIVIQAKRYTNTVGVSAVRDLYGTLLNEGANKGILVTTSNYGSDSYEFAKDKPLTLIDGNNLLYLLEQNGRHARIDINEAKKINENVSKE